MEGFSFHTSGCVQNNGIDPTNNSINTSSNSIIISIITSNLNERGDASIICYQYLLCFSEVSDLTSLITASFDITRALP